MDNLLRKYMDLRLENAKHCIENYQSSDPGPIITISREPGCFGNDFADCLCKYLNIRMDDMGIKNRWQCYNKQVVTDAARELNLPDSKVKSAFNRDSGSAMNEIISAMAHRYY